MVINIHNVVISAYYTAHTSTILAPFAVAHTIDTYALYPKKQIRERDTYAHETVPTHE